MAEVVFDGETLKNKQGWPWGSIKGNNVLNWESAPSGSFSEDTVFDAEGVPLARLVQHTVYDMKGHPLTTLPKIATEIEGAEGIRLAALWRLFMWIDRTSVTRAIDEGIDYNEAVSEDLQQQGHSEHFLPGDLVMCKALKEIMAAGDPGVERIRQLVAQFRQSQHYGGIVSFHTLKVLDLWLAQEMESYERGTLLRDGGWW